MSVHVLLVLVTEVHSLLNLCRPKDTSSLGEVLRAPAGPLMEAADRPGVAAPPLAVAGPPLAVAGLTFSEPLLPHNKEEKQKVRRDVGGNGCCRLVAAGGTTPKQL